MEVVAENSDQEIDAFASEKLRIVFYEEKNGTPNFTEKQIAHLFERARAERLLSLVMYDVDSELPASAMARLFQLKGSRRLFILFYERELAGWVWLDDFANRTARSHFCFFRWVAKAKYTEPMGREVFRRLFKLRIGSGQIQVFRAAMPSFNKPGLWFLESLGFRRIGEIPDAAYRAATASFGPMTYLYLHQDDFDASAVKAAS